MEKKLIKTENGMNVYEITSNSGKKHVIKLPEMETSIVACAPEPTQEEIILARLDYLTMLVEPVEVV